jgi:hypothetical protein
MEDAAEAMVAGVDDDDAIVRVGAVRDEDEDEDDEEDAAAAAQTAPSACTDDDDDDGDDDADNDDDDDDDDDDDKDDAGRMADVGACICNIGFGHNSSRAAVRRSTMARSSFHRAPAGCEHRQSEPKKIIVTQANNHSQEAKMSEKVGGSKQLWVRFQISKTIMVTHTETYKGHK